MQKGVKIMGKWYDEAVFYHIYPLGLTGAPMNNTDSEVVHRFEELNKWIPHMKEMSVTATYIGPLFESSTHGYDTRDYKTVDRRLGDNEDFKRFVQLCHKEGIKVVVDGVFNHTGREFFAFKDIQKNRENSIYRDWYRDLYFGGNSAYNDGFSYAAWRGCQELVNLNLDNPKVKEYLFDVIRFWIKEFDIDGIRLDCADCLTFDFMKEMRYITGLEKEDFWLMGEVIHGDYGRWANNDVLHSVTDYELHKGLYSGHNDHNYFEIAHTIRRLFDENGGLCRNAVLYTFADNHDVDRLASKLKDKEHLGLIYMLVYTLPGIPSIYYGSEWGIEGKKEGNSDAPLRPAISVDDEKIKNNNPKLTNLIKQLGKMKLENKDCLCKRYKELMLTNRQYAFARYNDEAAIVVILNNDENKAGVKVALNLPFEVRSVTDAFTKEEIKVQDNCIVQDIDGNSGIILKIN